MVRGDSRWTTLRELLSQVRTAPVSHRIGTSGTGGASILALARLFESGGIALADLGRVTFHGGAAILHAVIDGRTDLAAHYVVAWLDAAGFHEALKQEYEVALATATRLGLRR